MNDQKKLYKLIQTYSFVIYETALYLDGHPTCRKAMEYYNKYREKLNEVTRMYEENYGPMTIMGHNACSDSWKWVETPWPWEYDDDDCSNDNSHDCSNDGHHNCSNDNSHNCGNNRRSNYSGNSCGKRH